MPRILKQDEVEEVRNREALATAGPWHVGFDDGSGTVTPEEGGRITTDESRAQASIDDVVMGNCEGGVLKEDDATFIASAREDVPNLINTLAAHRDLIAAMTAELRRNNPHAFLAALGERVALGCYDEHDAAALARWGEKQMGGGK